MNFRNTLNDEYRELIRDIESFAVLVNTALEKHPDIMEYYKGFRVMYSNLIPNPTIMFIGINPGSWCDNPVICLGVDDKLEYIDDSCNNYRLAQETIEVFKNINEVDLLKTSAVKTNYFYVATTKQSQFYDIATGLGRNSKDDLGELLFIKAQEWTKKLIEIFNPKIIICEGGESYSNVTALFGDSLHLNDDIGSMKPDNCNFSIIGYKRRWSNIKNKEGLSNLLQVELRKIERN